jgi:AmiR/NasT family two-component response regulator
MMNGDREHLRVLVANKRQDSIDRVAAIVQSLGHAVVAGCSDIAEVGALAASERPDVALVGLGRSAEGAVEQIGRVAHEAACPVIALLERGDAALADESARRGVFAYVVDGDPESLQGALDITLRCLAESQQLQRAFGRRAITERAKGILMERHQVGEQRAFDLLRDQARRNGRKLVDVAQSIVDSHPLLPARPGLGSQPHE